MISKLLSFFTSILLFQSYVFHMYGYVILCMMGENLFRPCWWGSLLLVALLVGFPVVVPWMAHVLERGLTMEWCVSSHRVRGQGLSSHSHTGRHTGPHTAPQALTQPFWSSHKSLHRPQVLTQVTRAEDMRAPH